MEIAADKCSIANITHPTPVGIDAVPPKVTERKSLRPFLPILNAYTADFLAKLEIFLKHYTNVLRRGIAHYRPMADWEALVIIP